MSKSKGNGFGKSFTVKVFKLHQFLPGKKRRFRYIELPVNWKIKIVKGEVKCNGSKVAIKFLQFEKIGCHGMLTPKNTVSAEVMLSESNKISFDLKSPIFALKNGGISLITNVGAHAMF